jgi:hypothetical protein
MIIDIPNVGQVNFPDSMSESEVNAAAKRLFDEAGTAQEPVAEDKGVVSALRRGLEQTISSGQTAIESVTKGGEEAARRAQERQADIQRRLGTGASLERLQKVYQDQGILPAARELGSQILPAIAEQAPNIGATLGGAAAGAAAGSLAGPVGTVVGGITGAFAPSFVQQYGGNIQRQAEAQTAEGKPLDISRTAAAGTAVPQAGLDVLGTLIPLGGNIVTKILGPTAGKLIGATGSKVADEALLTTIAKGTAKGIAAEVPTEVSQQILERAQAGLSLTDESALREYGETAFAVSLLGPLGIIGRLSDKSQAGRDLALAQQKAIETNEPQQVPLQLAYDPAVSGVGGTFNPTPFTVFPDGRIAPSDQAAFDERFKPISTVPSPEEEALTKPLMPAEAFEKIQPVAVIQPDGTVKTFNGIPNKNNTGINLLDENNKVIDTVKPDKQSAVINPTERDIFRLETSAIEKRLPKIRQDVDAARIEANKVEGQFKQFIKDHPIQSQYYADIINPKHNRTRALTKTQHKDMFVNSTEKGYHIDDLAAIAHENGYLSDAEFTNVDDVGGVNAFIDKIAQAYDNQPVDTAAAAQAKANYQTLDKEYKKLDAEVQSRKEQVAQFPLEEEETVPTFIPPEQAAPIAPTSIAAQARYEPVVPSFRAEVKTPYSDKFVSDGKKLASDFRKAMDRMGLQSVGLQFEERLIRTLEGKTDEISGAYFDNLIRVSLSSSDPIRTLNHEALHAMKDLGMFSPKEWATLESMAKSKWMKQYDIANPDNYGNESQEIQLEEAIAHAFADYQKQTPAVKTIANRIRKFLGQLRNLLMGKGFRTTESVFQKAAEGKLTPTKAPTVTETRAQVPTREKFKAPMQGVDPAYAEKLRQQFTQEQATVKERMEGLKKNFFERMMIGVFDEFRTIKKYDPTAYMMARLSKSIDGGLQGLLEYGQVYIRDGALDIKPNTKGLLKILEPVGSEVDQYQSWKALSRDANLPADKRSFPADLVAGRNQLVQGTLNGQSRKAVYEKALSEENELNRSVLNVALQTGLIGTTKQEIEKIKNSKLSDSEKKTKIKELEDNPVGYEKFANDIYYIPFYKQMEDGDVQSVSAAAKLTGQQFSKALKGGEKKVNDLMENVLLNWSHILSAAMKNQAAVKTIDAAQRMGAAQEAKPMDGKYPKDSVKVMKDGRVVHYELSDPDLVDAISTISYLGPKSQFLDIARGFTNALRYGITLSPAYKVRNLIRDSIQSAAISELGPNMFSNVYNGLSMSKDGHPTFMAALAGGGIFEMGTAHEGNQAKLIKRLVDQGVNANHILDSTDKIKAKLQGALDWYNEQGNKFENANRLALYQKLIDSGKTHLEASYAARDLMDFSMQGQFRAIKIIGSVVPFFNARLQGLYKLGRDGITPFSRVIYNATTGKPIDVSDKQKAMRFATISGAVMLASLALYDMYKDDEDFKRREDWDRDNFWWFKIGDTAYRIPKPFEIGALGTIAERTYEQIADENVEGKVFADRMNRILMDTLSLNPTPQMIKPLIDLYANKDSFTGAPIESAGMQNLSKQERINNNTSGVAIALGGITEGAAKILTFNPQAQGFSPVQIDYSIKAYLGWLGATATSTADLAVEPFSEGTKVRKPVIDTLAMGFIKTEPEIQSKYMTQFYQNNANLQSALADMRHYAELGDSEKVQKIMEEKGNDIALAKVYDKTSKQLAELRKQSRLIENNQTIPTEERRAEMVRLKILMSTLAEQAESIRKQLNK